MELQSFGVTGLSGWTGILWDEVTPRGGYFEIGYEFNGMVTHSFINSLTYKLSNLKLENSSTQ